MANAVLGDEVFGDDPTTNKLNKDIAELLGKEAAILTSSGTQANLIAMMLIANQKGEAVIIGDNSHIAHYERGGMSSIGSVFPRVIQNLPDGTLDLHQIKHEVPSADDTHIVRVAGISLESSQNNCSGRALLPEYISSVKKITKKNKLKLHLDGARAWNAAIFLGISMKEMVKDFDIVNICLSKGMGCPAGSMIAGSHEDIKRARVLRKMLGGGMRQTGILSACGLVSLMDWEEKLLLDNQNAKFLATELASIPGVLIDPDTVDTNIVRFKIDDRVLKKIKLDHNGLKMKLREDHQILCTSGFHNNNIRLVTHR